MVSHPPDGLGSQGWGAVATLRLQEEVQALGKRHHMPVKVGENLLEAIDEELKVAGPNFDIVLWRPANKTRREIPDDSQGD